MTGDDMIMASPAEVAAREGVTKQAVTKLVRSLAEKHALPVERDGRGRIVRFSLAHFDHLRGAYASSEKIAAARRDPASNAGMADGASADAAPPPQVLAATSPGASSTSRDEALRQEAWLKVTREKLRRQEEIGQLVRADRQREALTICGREIQSLIGRLQNRADDMSLAVSREGVHGLRVLLRKISAELNGEIADALARIMDQAAEHDELIEDEPA